MEFRVLGPLEVLEGGRSIAVGGARQRALLAILLTRANEVVSTDRLIDELWGEQPPRTALNTLQYFVSQLRKALGAERIVRRAPGYAIQVEPGELDLERFETLVAEGGADRLREALSLWRGPPLADFAYEPFAQSEIARLEELRLAALEKRIEADLALGRHRELVAELEALAGENPLRERFRAQLMLALYRSGRQAEALEVYQATRRALVEELGIEPSAALQELEKAVLRQDPALDLAVAPPPLERAILVAVRDEQSLDSLLALAEPLARRPARELILVALVDDPDELAAATARTHVRRESLAATGITARAAAFTSQDAAVDLVRVAAQQDVDLVLLDGSPSLLETGPLPAEVERLLAEAPCDVAMLVRAAGSLTGDRPILVPFGGAEHDWAAIEVAAWIAGAAGAQLRLLGSAGRAGRRDASRLLASASLLVQRAVGIPTEPVLVAPGADAIVAASAEGALVVAGLSDRWRQEGLGETRLALARDAKPPALFVKRGLRPGGLAPEASLTRFTWSLRPSDH